MYAFGVTLLFLSLLIHHCDSVFRFANYIQDHMVLQRAPQRAVLWGYGDANALIILKISDRIYTTSTAREVSNNRNESLWSITLDAMSEDGPFDIQVTQSSINGTLRTIALHDILFGDVWICAGQSNMQMTVSQIFNGTEEIRNAGKYPKIRVFTASLVASAAPVSELLSITLKWSRASPVTIGGPDRYFMSALCWLYGRMIHQALDGRPIGLVAASWDGTPIESWMPAEALRQCNETDLVSKYHTVKRYVGKDSHDIGPWKRSSLFNAMIHPFTRMSIYGSIWYQGEQNVGNPTYACKFAKMIESWREIWYQGTNSSTHNQFPFGFVQLSTFTNDSNRVGGYPMLRWQQTFNVGYVPNHVVPKVFMAVSLDLRDDPNRIHPRTKHDVAYRLSRSALAVAYEQPVEFQGPLVQSVIYSLGSERVKIVYTGVSSIELRSSAGFEVCCRGSECMNDTTWLPSPVASTSGLSITLTVPSACVDKQLYGLRYLWRETPCPFKQAAIYSGADTNLPSPPYIKLFTTHTRVIPSLTFSFSRLFLPCITFVIVLLWMWVWVTARRNIPAYTPILRMLDDEK